MLTPSLAATQCLQDILTGSKFEQVSVGHTKGQPTLEGTCMNDTELACMELWGVETMTF